MKFAKSLSVLCLVALVLMPVCGCGSKTNVFPIKAMEDAIKAETPAFIQLDLTKEALTDFTYSWAKVSINTKDDKLIFKLHINGKPARPLKYAFKEDEQQFIRSEVPYNFAGIQLEVNFNLPLSDIMAMGFDLKKIMDKLQ